MREGVKEAATGSKSMCSKVHVTLEKIKKQEPDTDIKCVGNS